MGRVLNMLQGYEVYKVNFLDTENVVMGNAIYTLSG